MNVTIADYNGYNSKCESVQKALMWLEKKGEVPIEDLYKKICGTWANVIRFGEIRKYLIVSRLEEFDRFAQQEGAYIINELDVQIDTLKTNLQSIEYTSTLNPTRMYVYFRKNKTNLTQREHDKVVHDVLHSLLRGAVFEDDDYSLLLGELKRWHQYHYDTEIHYRWACSVNNRSAAKSIENHLNRKPFLIGTKRCYEGFEFRTSNTEWYKCTGFDEGKIKFVVYENGIHQGSRKLFKFTNKEFKEHFKDKKIQ